MPNFDVAGPGRKQCPGCKKFCGVRCNACPGCDYSFQKPKVSKPAAPKAPPTASRGGTVQQRVDRPDPGERDTRIVLSTPAGKPPVELTGTSEDVVLAWGRACMMADRTYIHTPESLGYWARYTYHMMTPEWVTVREHLEKLRHVTVAPPRDPFADDEEVSPDEEVEEDAEEAPPVYRVDPSTFEGDDFDYDKYDQDDDE